MMSRRLLESSRWLLLVAVITSAWLWGTTREWTKDLVCGILLIDTALFASALIGIRRFPRIPTVAAAIILFVLAQGWILTGNTRTPLPPGSVIPDHHGGILQFIPGFVGRADSFRAMLLISGLLGAFCIASDLSANRLWRMRLWKTLALTGTSIVALGLIQRLTNAPAIFWNVYENTGETFFGVFRYHANAGAFINLMIPLTAGLAILSLRERWHDASRVFWITATLATLVAVCVNVSRGAIAVTGAIFLAGFFWLLPSACIHYRRKTKKILLPLLFFVTAASLLIFSFGADRLIYRWNSGGISDPRRILTYQVIISHVLPQSGLWGFGPGSFEPVFAAVVSADHLPVKGRWDKAHNDHLQTLVEWGWLGYSAWAILLLGALWKGVALANKASSLSSRTLGISCTLSLGGVALHALIDFPLQIASIELISVLVAGMLWGAQNDKGKGALTGLHPERGVAKHSNF